MKPTWFNEIEGDVLHRFDSYLNGDYKSFADDFYLVHCVSGDNAQEAGFAKILNDRYHFRDSLCADLAESFPGFGTDGWTFDRRHCDFFRIPLLKDDDGEYSAGKIQRMRFKDSIGHIYTTERCPHILGLVTKHHYYEKPSLYDMRVAIRGLRERLELVSSYEYGMLTEIMMPHIGCGLDKLRWEDVKEVISEELHGLGDGGNIRVVAFEQRGPIHERRKGST